MGHPVPPIEPEPIGEDCDCFETGKTPIYYTVEISGVLDCECPDKPDGSSINGIWRFVQEPVLDCFWGYRYGLGDGIYGNLQISTPANGFNITMGVRVGAVHYPALYYIEAADCRKSGTENNAQTCFCAADRIGHEGTVKWCEGWHPGGCS